MDTTKILGQPSNQGNQRVWNCPDVKHRIEPSAGHWRCTILGLDSRFGYRLSLWHKLWACVTFVNQFQIIQRIWRKMRKFLCTWFCGQTLASGQMKLVTLFTSSIGFSSFWNCDSQSAPPAMKKSFSNAVARSFFSLVGEYFCFLLCNVWTFIFSFGSSKDLFFSLRTFSRNWRTAVDLEPWNLLIICDCKISSANNLKIVPSHF